MTTLLEIFCCYAREDQEMLTHLIKHLTPLQRQGQIMIWSDTNLNAGIEWERQLHRHLESADIILLLISPDFMASDYCYSIEMKRAIERHNEGSASVIPILLRSTFWDNAPFAKLQMLPTAAKHVTSWLDRDEAFHDITRHINQVISNLQTQYLPIEASTHFNPFLPKSIAQVGIKEQQIQAQATYKQVVLSEHSNALMYQNKDLEGVEITPDAVKAYLDKLLGPDSRVKKASYEFIANMLQQLDFRHFYEIDICIAEYVYINANRDLSTIAWGAKKGQIMKFETLLLASMGESFINKYPKEKITDFKIKYSQALRRLKRAGIDVGKTRMGSTK